MPEFVSAQTPVDNVKFALADSVKVTGLALLVTVLLIGVTGAAVPADVVVILGGVPVRLVDVKTKGPPTTAVVIFCIATTGMAGFTVLVIVQLICALARIFVAGMVSTVPANVPKLPAGLPEAAAFPSVQLAAVRVKFVTTGSVMVTATPVALARMGAATAGYRVAVLAVVMFGGFDARLVEVNENGPPIAPRVCFCNDTVATLAVATAFVRVQFILAAASTFAAGMVSTLPESDPKLAGFPVTAEFESVQVADVAVKLAAGVSVIVTAVLKDVMLIAVGTAGVAVAAAVVVMAAGLDAKFVAVKVNGPPTANVVIFCKDTVAVFGVLVKMQAMASP